MIAQASRGALLAKNWHLVGFKITFRLLSVLPGDFDLLGFRLFFKQMLIISVLLDKIYIA